MTWWSNPFATKLNEAAKMPKMVALDADPLWVQHRQEEAEDRAEFLRLSTPAFMYALRVALNRHIFELNIQLHRPADRMQLHVDQEALRSMFISSNLETTKRIQDETAIEVSISNYTGEITEKYRKHDENPLRICEMWLYLEQPSELRIASSTRSFSASEYACDLITRFLEEREASREISAKVKDSKFKAK